MKKHCYEIINKGNYKPLDKQKEYRRQKAIVFAFLKKRNIPAANNTDFDLFQYEIIRASLIVKERIEEIFLETYIQMYDYWNDLSYLERKAQMQIGVNEYLITQKCFSDEQHRIYMPCFNSRINNLYTVETVLLDLKQYKTIIKDYIKDIQPLHFGAKAFAIGLCNAQLVLEENENYVIYSAITNCFYLCCQTKCLKYCAFIKNDGPLERDVQTIIANHLINNREIELIDYLQDTTLISDKIKHKLAKWKLAKLKKLEKTRSKND